jgi:hypothetical protein
MQTRFRVTQETIQITMIIIIMQAAKGTVRM